MYKSTVLAHGREHLRVINHDVQRQLNSDNETDTNDAQDSGTSWTEEFDCETGNRCSGSNRERAQVPESGAPKWSPSQHDVISLLIVKTESSQGRGMKSNWLLKKGLDTRLSRSGYHEITVLQTPFP